MTYFLFTRWVSAEAATLFAALLEFELLRIFDALEATTFDVTSFFLAMWIHPSFAGGLMLQTEIPSLPNVKDEPRGGK